MPARSIQIIQNGVASQERLNSNKRKSTPKAFYHRAVTKVLLDVHRTQNAGILKLLGDTAAVSSMLDRLLHYGHVLKCGPRSWRTKDAVAVMPETK